MAGIDELTAAQLSQAAYSSGAVSGWTAVYNYATTDANAGTNSFTIYVNDFTHQAVFAFKGSDDVGNFQSDLANSGGAAWEDLRSQADAEFTAFHENNPTYTIMSDGHSLGSGMAQTFALEHVGGEFKLTTCAGIKLTR